MRIPEIKLAARDAPSARARHGTIPPATPYQPRAARRGAGYDSLDEEVTLMRRLGFLFLTLAAVGCAANPAPVPDYPANDENMAVDTEMLNLDLEPRGDGAGGEESGSEPEASPEAAEE